MVCPLLLTGIGHGEYAAYDAQRSGSGTRGFMRVACNRLLDAILLLFERCIILDQPVLKLLEEV